MRGGALPPSLLLAALGLALAFAPRGSWLGSALLLCAGVGASALLPLPASWVDGVYLALWASVAVTAASVHFVRGLGHAPVAIALSLNAGVWTGAVVRLSGSRLDLPVALACCVLLWVPASWLVRRRAAIAPKVVASWIVAVAVLAATLQLLPVTPGYLPDHLE